MKKAMKNNKIPTHLVIYKNEKTGEVKIIELLDPIRVSTALQMFEFQYNNRSRTRLFANFIPDSVKSDLESGDLDYIRDMYNQVVHYSKRENFANITINLN